MEKKKEKSTESGQKGTDRRKRFEPSYDSTKIWELMDCMCYQCVCVFPPSLPTYLLWTESVPAVHM